ncbi:MAG: PEGA domain-containing protein [Polyangiales bacterium]
MRERNVTIVWGFLIALVTQAPLVHAQSADERAAPTEQQKRDASTHFNRGAELFSEGVYRGALVELKRAYEIAPNYRVLYNIGQTHVALGEFVEATEAFQTFLAQGGSAVDASRRSELETQIGLLKKRSAQVSIEVDRAGARVAIDGEEVGTAPLAGSIAVNVGQHRITARTDDGATASEEIDVAGGDVREVSLTLSAPAVATSEVPREAPPPERKLSRRKKWAIGLLSGAGALALSGLAVALVARSARDDHDNALSARPGDPVAIDAAHDKLARTAISADVLFGAAVATGVAGTVLLLLREPTHEAQPADEPTRVRVSLAPNGLVASGRF